MITGDGTPGAVSRRPRPTARSIAQGLLLYGLTLIGSVPSHTVRNAVYRMAGVTLPRSSTIHWRARFFNPRGLTIGEHTTIGNDAFLDGRRGLHIGSCVNIAAEVRIYTLQHDLDDPHFGVVGGPVVIEDYAHIGARVTILPGVRIGRGAVVGSGAVVTKSVDDYVIAGGVPARPIRRRRRDLRYRSGKRVLFQ